MLPNLGARDSRFQLYWLLLMQNTLTFFNKQIACAIINVVNHTS
jgi:hypothetical protein